MIFVISGSAYQFDVWAHYNQIDINKVVNVTRYEHLYGAVRRAQQKDIVICVGSYRTSMTFNSASFTDYINSRGIMCIEDMSFLPTSLYYSIKR